MKSAVVLALCLFVLAANAYPMFYPVKQPTMRVPFHPYPVYGPGYGAGPRPGFGDGLTLLTSAALLGSGNPAAQALGGLGLVSLF